MTHQPAFDPLPKMDGDSDKNLSRFLPVGGGTQSLSVPNEVGIQDLAHNLVPGGIPFFFLLLHRYMKKHSSYKTRAAIIGLGAGLYLSRRWRGYLGHLVQQYFLCTAEVREGDEGYDMLLSVSNLDLPFPRSSNRPCQHKEGFNHAILTGSYSGSPTNVLPKPPEALWQLSQMRNEISYTE